MGINRSGFYNWRNRKDAPSDCEIRREEAIKLFSLYHTRYPTHGYRWLRAKIQLDTNKNYPDQFAHRVCKYLGIKSQAKRIKRYGKAGKGLKNFPNLILKDLQPEKPFEVIVSDMTAFYYDSAYYELTLFMDLFSNKIVAYHLTDKRGDANAYHDALSGILKQKRMQLNFETVLHTDQGSVYCSKRFNERLAKYNILHSVSKPGTPTENGAMEAINGWIKEELFGDLWLAGDGCDIKRVVDNYIYYFNYERPAYALGYLTPIQYEKHYYKNVQNGLVRVD